MQGRCLPLVDIESSLFSPIAKAFDAAWPNGSRASEPTESPAQFPFFALYEADRFYAGYSGLDAKRLVVDVDVYSNLVSGAKQQCREIMAMVEEMLQETGPWEQVFCNPIKNAETGIFRMKARYRATAVQESQTDGTTTVRVYRK